MLGAVVAQCLVAHHLLFDGPVFVSVEIRHVRVVLLSVELYDHVLSGQVEIRNEILQVQVFVFVWNEILVMVVDALLSQPCEDACFAGCHAADGATAAFAQVRVGRAPESIVVSLAGDGHRCVVVHVLVNGIREAVAEFLMRLFEEVFFAFLFRKHIASCAFGASALLVHMHIVSLKENSVKGTFDFYHICLDIRSG